jgi:predicted RNA-binding Zn-ribbon protein involved in translation (DUF1610 family)
MAREIAVLCDACMSEDQRSEGATYALGLDGPLRTIDLCEAHRKDLLDPLLALVESHGAPVEAPTTRGSKPAAAQSWPCPECGQTSPTRGALSKHAQVMHHQSLDELEGIATHYCPQCGLGYKRFQGYSMHMRASHSLTSAEAREVVLYAKPAAKPTGKPARRSRRSA